MSGWDLIISMSYSKLTGQLLSMFIIYTNKIRIPFVFIDVNNSYLCVSLTNPKMLAHINVVREYLILFAINNWESMNGYEYFITLAMNPNAVVIILVFIVWCELHIYFLCDACRDHALFVIFNFEEVCLRGKDVETLRGRGVID